MSQCIVPNHNLMAHQSIKNSECGPKTAKAENLSSRSVAYYKPLPCF
jgi:hypothetical protein